MSIWKPINQNDVSRNSSIVHKEYTLYTSSAGYNVVGYRSGSLRTTGDTKIPNESGSYWTSLRFNFYLSTSLSGEYSNSLNTTIFNLGHDNYTLGSQYREIPQHRNKFHSSGSVINIPQEYFGEAIKRKSVTITGHYMQGNNTIKPILKDDGYGNLYVSGSAISHSNNHPSSSDNYIGNIFYNLGIATITDTGSYSHTPSTASMKVKNVDLNDKFYISSSDLSTSLTFHVTGANMLSGALTDTTTIKYFVSCSAPDSSHTSASHFLNALSASKKINEIFWSTSSAKVFSSSVSGGVVPTINMTNDRKPDRPYHFVDNLPPISSSDGFSQSKGFGGGVASINYTDIFTDGGSSFKFKSEQEIFTTEYVVSVNPGEFNYTNNPTSRRLSTNTSSSAYLTHSQSPFLLTELASGSITGNWGPMITTIGLYRNYPNSPHYQHLNNLIDPRPVIIAKYPQPIMTRKDVRLIFKVKLDD